MHLNLGIEMSYTTETEYISFQSGCVCMHSSKNLKSSFKQYKRKMQLFITGVSNRSALVETLQTCGHELRWSN